MVVDGEMADGTEAWAVKSPRDAAESGERGVDWDREKPEQALMKPFAGLELSQKSSWYHNWNVHTTSHAPRYTNAHVVVFRDQRPTPEELRASWRHS